VCVKEPSTPEATVRERANGQACARHRGPNAVTVR
jgi:hypothetical protein